MSANTEAGYLQRHNELADVLTGSRPAGCQFRSSAGIVVPVHWYQAKNLTYLRYFFSRYHLVPYRQNVHFHPSYHISLKWGY